MARVTGEIFPIDNLPARVTRKGVEIINPASSDWVDVYVQYASLHAQSGFISFILEGSDHASDTSRWFPLATYRQDLLLLPPGAGLSDAGRRVVSGHSGSNTIEIEQSAQSPFPTGPFPPPAKQEQVLFISNPAVVAQSEWIRLESIVQDAANLLTVKSVDPLKYEQTGSLIYPSADRISFHAHVVCARRLRLIVSTWGLPGGFSTPNVWVQANITANES